MIDRLMSGLAKWQQKYPLPIILIVLTISAFFTYYAVRLETDSSFDVLFSDDSETMQLQNLLSNTFGSTETLFVLVQVDSDSNEQEGVKDIRDPSVMIAMRELSKSMEEESSVSSTTSLADILLMVYGKLPSNLEESKQMIDNLPENVKEAYLGAFLSDDLTSQSLLISVDIANKPGSLAKIEEIANQKIEETPFPLGVKAKLTGVPVLMNRIMGYLINDNIRTIGFAIIGVFFILWIYFRSSRIAFFSIIPVVLTLSWLAGTMYLMGIRITVMIASVGAMIIGMSVDYAIHLTHAYHSQVRSGQKNAALNAVNEVGPALFASVMTTIVGFLALVLGVTPNSQTQGTVLAIGITYAFIITIVLLPALMVFQRKFVYSKLDEVVFRIRGRPRDEKRQGIIEKFLSFIAGWQARRPLLVLGAVALATILIVPGFGLIYLDTDDDSWLPDHDNVVDNLREFTYQFGGTDSMNLLFKIDDVQGDYDEGAVTDLRDPRVLLPMRQMDTVLSDISWIDVVESPTSDIYAMTSYIPQDIEDAKSLFQKYPDLSSKYNDDYSLARITLRFDGMDREDFYEVMDEVNAIDFPNEIEIIPQGGVPQDIELEQTLNADTLRTTLMGFGFVILVASIMYASVLSGILAFFPIIIAIVWTVGTMGYINLPFTVLTTGMLAILMGLGIDFSIHIMHSIKTNMRKFKDIEKALPEALLSTGQAISITTLTTVFGFMVLTFATLVNTKRLGWTLALGILCTFLACILIVPAVMALRYKIRGVRNE